MDYKALYHELNHRRKNEFLCYENTLYALKQILEKCIELKNDDNFAKGSELLNLCNDACLHSEELYQSFVDSDRVIEELYISSCEKLAVIYPLHLNGEVAN